VIGYLNCLSGISKSVLERSFLKIDLKPSRTIQAMESFLSTQSNLLNTNLTSSSINDVSSSSLPLILVGPFLQILGSFLLTPLIPSHVQTSRSRTSKWRATFLARIAAGVSGCWAVLALYQSYHLRADLMFGSSPMAVNLIIFSLGVHIAEMMDMLSTGKFSLLAIHHIAVIICFAGAIVSSKAIGFAVLTLVTELNAVTNKTRILHIISDTDTMSVKYRTNAITNIFTFFIRILIIFWMNNQSFLYFMQEPTVFFGCCSLGLMFVNLWNLQVFKTLIVKDILVKSKTA